MIAIDMDGTLLGNEGQVSPRNLAALLAAQAAGVEIVIATGRRHCYAMHILRPLELHHASILISSNGTVTRTLGSFGDNPIPSRLLARTHLLQSTALWLCGHVDEFRNALVLTFDRVGPNGEDSRGALVVEHRYELTASIGRWMAINEPYIAHVNPIEDALTQPSSDGDPNHPGDGDPNYNAPIQAMLCGTVERMARAEARLLEHPGVIASDHPSGRSPKSLSTKLDPAQRGAPCQTVSPSDVGMITGPSSKLASPQSPGAPSMTAPPSRVGSTTTPTILNLHRTVYPNRDLSILDILPPGCSKGAAILELAATQGIDPSEILAIGDNWNDVSMLEIAGSAVLMDNAPEDLKAMAQTRGWRIGLANTEDGVAEAIESALAVTC